MSEPNKQQIGDGSDNYGNAAKQGANAIKKAGKNAAKESAKKGAEATGRAAVNTVKVGAKTGKAVSEIAAGTAAGGPWGAIISAAWSMRHTLFKILICVCLVVVFIVVTVVALPDILYQNIKNIFKPDTGQTENVVQASYMDLSAVVTAAIEQGHRDASAKVENIISEGGYDRTFSTACLSDLSSETRQHDICYILAAYSVAAEHRDVSRENLVYKLNQATEDMFQVSYEVRQITMTVTDGDETREKTVDYVACTIHPLDMNAVCAALGLNTSEPYGDTGKSCGEIVAFYTESLERILNFGG